MKNEGLHPQNWRLEVKNGSKGPELGQDGMAMSIDELKKQLDTAQKTLESAKADRADMDDQPNLSEGSQIKVEDLPVADDADKAYMDSEVAKAQEKVDRVQAKLEVAMRIEQIKSISELIKTRSTELEKSKEQLSALKKSIVDLSGADADEVALSFDIPFQKVDQQIQTLLTQKADLGVLMILAEANLRGEFNDDDTIATAEILKESSDILTGEMRDRATRIAEKTMQSQIKDAQELAEYRELAKKMKGVELARLNREITLLEKSLEAAGIKVDDADEMAALTGLNIERKTAETEEEVVEDETTVEVANEVDQAVESFMDKFLASEDLLADLDKAINDKNNDEIVRIVGVLETNATEIPIHINDVKSDELKNRFQKLWDEMNLVEKITEAKKQLVEAESEEDVVTTPEGDAAVETTEADNEDAGVDEETVEAAPVLSRRARLFKKVTGMFTGVFTAVSWLNRNAGERDPAEPVSTGESAPVVDKKAKEESAKIYDVQSKSLNRIDREIKMILFRKEKGKPDADDANKFAFALDSLYVTDLEFVNDDETRLTEKDQKMLNAQIDRISQVLEKGMGANWDVIVTNMENEVDEKDTLADESADRFAWFVRLFNGEPTAVAVEEPAVGEEPVPEVDPLVTEAVDVPEVIIDPANLTKKIDKLNL